MRLELPVFRILAWSSPAPGVSQVLRQQPVKVDVAAFQRPSCSGLLAIQLGIYKSIAEAVGSWVFGKTEVDGFQVSACLARPSFNMSGTLVLAAVFFRRRLPESSRRFYSHSNRSLSVMGPFMWCQICPTASRHSKTGAVFCSIQMCPAHPPPCTTHHESQELIVI